MRADRIGRSAAAEGFDWPDVTGPLAKVREELAEVEAALSAPADQRQAALQAEVGDLLFSAVNVARHLGVDPEAALSLACDRFESRYAGVRTRLGPAAATATLAELDAAWEAVKRHER
jgi:ATP diphosphatase